MGFTDCLIISILAKIAAADETMTQPFPGKTGAFKKTNQTVVIILLLLEIVETSGSSLFEAGVGARHLASGGQFWPPEKNRKWPEVGIWIFYLFLQKPCSISYY